MGPQDTIKYLENKYEKIGASFKDLEGYIVNLEPELPIPLDEAMADYKRWLDAKNELEESTIVEENGEVELVDEIKPYIEIEGPSIQQ